MYKNTPDDYGSYWSRCPVCGDKIHPAEQPDCRCDEDEEESAVAFVVGVAEMHDE